MQDRAVHAAAVLRGESDGDRPSIARDAASWDANERARLVDSIIAEPDARRWLRSDLLPRLRAGEVEALASRLLDWAEDFAIDRRDRTTMAVPKHLSLEEVRRRAVELAGSNAAAALWMRLHYDDDANLINVALTVMSEGNLVARETTLHLLILDPYRSIRLLADSQRRLLLAALRDPAPEVRGLAADALADESPELLLADRDRWLRDPSERVRMSAWEVAFNHDYGRASADAVDLTLDESAPLDARRSALLALGSTASNAEVSSLLEAIVVHPQRELAEDAANLLWAHHRIPSVAQSAARSPHEAVRAIAERLLHPELGSPAAGGSRPGAPDAATDVYGQMLRDIRERRSRE